MSESLSSAYLQQIQTSRFAGDSLISRCLNGEEQAYAAVYNQYASSIYRLCYSLLHHREDAEEVLQDTFEYAFRKLEHFNPAKASLKTWLYQIAISRCRNKRRRKWLKTLPLNLLFGSESEDHEAISHVDYLILDETQRVVWNALDQLSPKLRETAILRYYEELTYAQIGEILSIPAKTAESRMRLAHKALRNMLMDKIGVVGLEKSR